jgi:DNA-binding beta-propeller fold protein YncE
VASGRVALHDARSGRLLRSVAVGLLPVALALDPATGLVLVAHLDHVNSADEPDGPGALSVLDGRSGAVRRTLPLGWGPSAIVVDAARGRVLVLTASGRGGDSPGAVQSFALRALRAGP